MTTVQKWGNSLAIRIPQVLAEELKVIEGTDVVLRTRNGELVVRPKSPKKFSLSKLLKNCKPSQLHGETNFGDDVGREAIEW
jgi:antitoxin MazE